MADAPHELHPMKVLTLNFVACAVKGCQASGNAYPLSCQDAELEELEVDFNPEFVMHMLPRLEWDALRQTVKELGLDAGTPLPETKPEITDVEGEEQQLLLMDLHKLLLGTQMREGKLVCRNCQHPYLVKEGIANFLLPPHLVSG